MKCPFRFRELFPDSVEEKILGGDCLKEECAWWDEFSQLCAVRCISGLLSPIAGSLLKIVDKLPTKTGMIL